MNDIYTVKLAQLHVCIVASDCYNSCSDQLWQR